MTMTAFQFRYIREKLGLSQSQLADVLGFKYPSYIRQMETAGTTRRDVPHLVAKLMNAYLAGYRPPDWPGAAKKAGRPHVSPPA
jgi:transcriptional regulator with XRE-family HTH domain